LARIAVVFGTRPEAIKMAPVINQLKANTQWETKVIVTGQHREMLDQMLQVFHIVSDYDLNIMRPGQSLADITIAVLRGMDQFFCQWRPDLLLVHGDPTSALAAALAGFYQQIPVGHVEAGLRTGNLGHPFPEEANRKLIDGIAALLFAPTQWAADNLRAEGIYPRRIFVTGNTVIDALQMMIEEDYQFATPQLQQLTFTRPVILVTAHRRENWGAPYERICMAISAAASTLPCDFVFALHKNPNLQAVVKKHLSGHQNVYLVDALDYKEFINLLNRCSFIVTDSGGLQEEAAALAKPVLVLREHTERPEGVAKGILRLIGTDQQRILNEITALITNPVVYQQMAKAENPYGDGRAAERISKIIADYFQRV